MKKIVITPRQVEMLSGDISVFTLPTPKKIYISESQYRKLFLGEQGDVEQFKQGQKDVYPNYVPKKRDHITRRYRPNDDTEIGWELVGEETHPLHIYPAMEDLDLPKLYVLRNQWYTCCKPSAIDDGTNSLYRIDDEDIINKLNSIYPNALLHSRLFNPEWSDEVWDPLLGEVTTNELMWPEEGGKHITVGDFCIGFPRVYPSYESKFNSLPPMLQTIVKRILWIAHTQCVTCDKCSPVYWVDCQHGAFMEERLKCAIEKFGVEYVYALGKQHEGYFDDTTYVSGGNEKTHDTATKINQALNIFQHFADDVAGNIYNTCNREMGATGSKYKLNKNVWVKGQPEECNKSPLDTIMTMGKWVADIMMCRHELDQFNKSSAADNITYDDWSDLVHCIVDVLSIWVSIVPYYGTMISAVLDGINAGWYSVEAQIEGLSQFFKGWEGNDWETWWEIDGNYSKMYMDIAAAGLSAIGVYPGVTEARAINKILTKAPRKILDAAHDITKNINKGKFKNSTQMMEMITGVIKKNKLSDEQAAMLFKVLDLMGQFQKKGGMTAILKESKRIEHIFKVAKVQPATAMRIFTSKKFNKILISQKGNIKRALIIFLLKKAGKGAIFQFGLLTLLAGIFPPLIEGVFGGVLPEWEQGVLEKYGEEQGMKYLQQLWFLFDVTGHGCDWEMYLSGVKNLLKDPDDPNKTLPLGHEKYYDDDVEYRSNQLNWQNDTISRSPLINNPWELSQCMEKNQGRKNYMKAIKSGFPFPFDWVEFLDDESGRQNKTLTEIAVDLRKYFPPQFKNYYNKALLSGGKKGPGILSVFNNIYGDAICYPKCTWKEYNDKDKGGCEQWDVEGNPTVEPSEKCKDVSGKLGKKKYFIEDL